MGCEECLGEYFVFCFSYGYSLGYIWLMSSSIEQTDAIFDAKVVVPNPVLGVN